MSKDKKRLKLPDECHRLSVNACTSQKVLGRCKIKRGFLGFNNRCVANENYESDKYLLEKGFKNFARIDEDNLEEELKLRSELCKQLSAEIGGTCESLKGREIGCEITSSLFGKKQCNLSKEIINFFYRRRKDCIAKDCNEPHKKYNLLCQEHLEELNELLQEYKSYYQLITFKKKYTEDDLFYFNDIYNYLNEIYGVYLLEKPQIRDGVEKMKMAVEILVNKNQCQAFNISTCRTGEIRERCKYKGYETKIGTFCKIHSQCYKERMKKYKPLRDNLEEKCQEERCTIQLDRLRELYNMIQYTTQGEASIYKTQVYETIAIIEEYSKI